KDDDFPIHSLIISLEFWPENLAMLSSEEMSKYRHYCGEEEDNTKKMRLPDVVHNAMENYTKVYESFNANRTLYWIYPRGKVELDLEFGPDKVMSFVVSPVHAAIIWCFQEKSTWSVSELSQRLVIPCTKLRRKIIYWQNKNILKELKNDRFTLIN